MDLELSVVEAELNSLVNIIKKIGGFPELEREILESINTVHYNGVTTERGLIDLISRIVCISKPPYLIEEWEEVWGNIFSRLVGFILSSEHGTETIISFLYGLKEIPAEAAGERVLCVNPGSTSTKLALFRGLVLEGEDEVHIPPDFKDSIDARTSSIIEWIESRGIGRGDLTGIACRGGFVRPVPTGTYSVNERMVHDLDLAKINHASNMAIPIGLKIRERFNGGQDLLVTTTDPVGSDEMSTGARLTGIRKLLRSGSGGHYLNQNAVHRLACSILGKLDRDLTTVGAHMGGGMSVMRHSDGDVCDLENAFSGVPSANRCGNIPLDLLIEAYDQREISIPELKEYLFRKGGLIDLAGTNDFKALLHFRNTGALDQQREKIDLVIDFMARNIAGAVMKLSAVEGSVDFVILTGGLARSSEFTGAIKRKLLPYFPVVIVPGSLENEALMAGFLRARFRPETLKDYVEERDRLNKFREYEEDLFETEIFAQPHLRKKENAPVTSLDEVIYLTRALVAKYHTPRIAIVGAENEEAIAAAKQANEEGHYPVAKFLLVGDYYEINRIAWDYDIKVDGDNYTIVDSNDPVQKSVDLLDSGAADFLMKGGVKTSEIMGAALQYLKKSGRIKKGNIYSHVGIFQIPSYPKLLMVTDAALIPSPSQNIKKKILENALVVAGYLNITVPKVAVISAVEVASPSVESSMLAAELSEEYKGRTDCIVEGPLSLDVAMSPHSAMEKRYPGQIRGNADILLMPDIEAGNVVYKSLTVSSGAYLGGAIVGAGVPIVLTSRGDSARSKLASICLASLIAMRQGDIRLRD
ncbi:MAG: butyrate kinase [Candidatus Krumholzibacteriota bacterium]|nr:butyrate kinase [Candidatus Krumholzibacteriota bacterium]